MIMGKILNYERRFGNIRYIPCHVPSGKMW
nr:MAG TPA: hypothetical protein [Bacteriophage sp.]